MNAWEKVR